VIWKVVNARFVIGILMLIFYLITEKVDYLICGAAAITWWRIDLLEERD